MRTKNSIKNITAALGGQFFAILFSLITRAVFVKTLSSEYLGLDGLFSNILTILSLIELGVGPAMTFSLYKPLADSDNEKIKSLMELYKKLYFIIGSAMIIIGILFLPFLDFFINTDIRIDNIKFIYILFLLNTALPYFFTYKTSLLITDQKKYIYNIYHYLFFVIYNVLQIIILFLTHNYILFLSVQIVIVCVQNIVIVNKVNKLYPFIKEKNVNKLDSDTEKNISKNVKAMIFHKLGSVLVTSTDNLIISKLVGLSAVALYSNYYLITNSLKKIISQIFDSVISSVGNLVAKENTEKVYDIFEKIFFFNYWIYAVTGVCLAVLLNDFIYLWVGKDYVFSFEILLIIVINYYLNGMRKSVLVFRDSMGLYWYDRYKPIFEALINIVFSVILAKKYGILGVFIGTLISNILTNLWIEPFVLYRYGFSKSTSCYFKRLFVYIVYTIILYIITNTISAYLFSKINFVSFIAKSLFSFIFINVCLIILNYKNQNYRYYKNLLKKILTRRSENVE